MQCYRLVAIMATYRQSAYNPDKGHFARGKIQRKVKQNMSEIVYCYVCALPAGPGFTAMVDGRFPRQVCSFSCKEEAEGKTKKPKRKSASGGSQRRISARRSLRRPR